MLVFFLLGLDLLRQAGTLRVGDESGLVRQARLEARFQTAWATIYAGSRTVMT